MSNLSKKIFITGATHGIGRATTELFCRNGWRVYGISSNEEDGRGAEMMKLLPTFQYTKCDVRKEEEIAALLQRIGPLDAAFNNAGIGKVKTRFDEEDIQEARLVIETNLIGTMICMKHEILQMRKGVIVNNASISALKADTGADASYSASKAGILRLTAEAAVCPEYMDRISFFSLLPGYIKTRMTAADNQDEVCRRLPYKKMGEPAEVARLVYEIIVNNYAFSSGQCFNLDEGAFLV